MEQWDFLLQKDGDRSWLPLDSPDVEILEGRYRIVARSNQANTEVNVAISHVTVDEDPPKRRSKRRSGRTNANGLIVILPYTHLRSGIWQITCTSTDVMADLLGAAWQRSVRLQVLALMGLEEDSQPTAPLSDRVDTVFASALPQVTTESQESPSIAIPLPIPTDLISQAVEPDESADMDVEGLPQLPALPTSDPAPTVEPVSANARPVNQSMPSIDDLATLNLEIAQVLGLSMDRLLEMTEQLSHQVVEEALRGLNLMELADFWQQSIGTTAKEVTALEAATVESPSHPELESPIAPESPTPAVEPVLIPIDALQLRLNSETLTARYGEPLTISGVIELNSELKPIHPAQPFPAWLQTSTELESEDETASPTEATLEEIRIYLRDPQTSQVLCSDRQPVTSITATYPFSFSLVVPPDLTTHLLVGEVAICGWLSEAAEAALVVLKSQPFSVTVDPEQLMAEWAKVNQTLANHTDTEDMLDLPVQLSVELAESQQRSLLDLSFLKLAKTPAPEPEPEPTPSVSSVTIGQAILPPQLYHPDPEQSGKRPLELPTFMAVAQTETELETELSSQAAPSEAPLETEAEAASHADETTTADEVYTAEAIDPPTLETIETIVQENDSLSVRQLDLDMVPVVVEEPLSPVEMAFQALNLQERFFNRLNALASDTDLKVSLEATSADTGTRNSHQAVATPMISTDFAASEFVVDDDPEFNDRRHRRSNVLTRSAIAEAPEESNPLILPPDEPVPVPILEILADELVAGETINIRVTLPNLLPRIYVKLWVNDRQTRSLLAGPQWLMDFFPNGFDALEAIIPLTIPQGSVEVRIEAIAVEIQTQRESRKVVLDRAVILDDFPLVSLDEFDL
ncbi:MAG TPA: hypothetical protein V6C64_17190 [Microcoleaceae cyanobacterium]